MPNVILGNGAVAKDGILCYIAENRDGTFNILLVENQGNGDAYAGIRANGGDAVLGWGIPLKASWHLGARNDNGDLELYDGSFKGAIGPLLRAHRNSQYGVSLFKRTEVIADSSLIALCIRYGPSDGAVVIGATPGATPDMAFINAAGNLLAKLTNGGDFVPPSDNTGDIGTPETRWASVNAETVRTDDLKFKNDWRFTEDEQHGIVLTSPEGKKFRMVEVTP